MSNKNLLNESQVRQFMKLASLEPLTPGFVKGLTETTKEGDELEELRTGRTGALAPPGGGHSPGHGRGQGEAADGSLFEEDELGATEDELGHEDHIADEEAEELDDLEAEAPLEDDGADQMISVQDLMTAITVALEDVTGQPVESEIEDAPVEDEVEMDVELDAGDDLESAGVELEDELALQETADDELEEAVTKGSDAEEDESLGMEDGKEADKDMSKKGRRKVARADARKDESTEATDELVEQIIKRVAARILKAALAKK